MSIPEVGNSNGEHQVQETPGGPGSKDKEKAEKDQVVASAGKQNKAPKSGPPKMSRKVVPDKKTALRYSVPVHQEKKVTSTTCWLVYAVSAEHELTLNFLKSASPAPE